jgi:hypothetical protein
MAGNGDFDMRDDETYSEYKSRKLREKGPGFNTAMGQKKFNPDDPKKSEAAQRARRNRNKGRRKQNLARKKLKIPNTKFRSMMGHEESWLGQVRVEVKAGQQVQSLWTKFKAAKQQSDENNSAIGNNKPFIFVAMPDGTTDGMVVMELDKLEETVFALLETWDDYEGE